MCLCASQMYVCTCMHAYIHMFPFMHTPSVRMCVYAYVCICVSVYVHTYRRMHVYYQIQIIMHSRTLWTWLYGNVHVCICVCIHVCVYTHMHANHHVHGIMHSRTLLGNNGIEMYTNTYIHICAYEFLFMHARMYICTRSHNIACASAYFANTRAHNTCIHITNNKYIDQKTCNSGLRCCCGHTHI